MEARLRHLSLSHVLRIAARGCESDLEVRLEAERLIRQHAPCPASVTEHVVMTADLLGHVLHFLNDKDQGSVAPVCALWNSEWKLGKAARRRLWRDVRFEVHTIMHIQKRISAIENEAWCAHNTKLLTMTICMIPRTGTPGCPKLFLTYGDMRYILFLDKDMTLCGKFEDGKDEAVADETFVYEIGEEIVKRDHHGMFVASHTHLLSTRASFCSPVLVSLRHRCATMHGGARDFVEKMTSTTTMLFCVTWRASTFYLDGDGNEGENNGDEGENNGELMSDSDEAEDDDALQKGTDEIIAIDADTMQTMYTFGKGTMRDARGMCVCRDSLYVCDLVQGCVHIFSVTREGGERTGCIRIDALKRPFDICCADDRLYVIEHSALYPTSANYGQRIFVLSQSPPTQEWSLLYIHEEPDKYFYRISHVDNALVLSYSSHANEVVADGMMAFRGL